MHSPIFDIDLPEDGTIIDVSFTTTGSYHFIPHPPSSLKAKTGSKGTWMEWDDSVNNWTKTPHGFNPNMLDDLIVLGIQEE